MKTYPGRWRYNNRAMLYALTVQLLLAGSFAGYNSIDLGLIEFSYLCFLFVIAAIVHLPVLIISNLAFNGVESNTRAVVRRSLIAIIINFLICFTLYLFDFMDLKLIVYVCLNPIIVGLIFLWKLCTGNVDECRQNIK